MKPNSYGTQISDFRAALGLSQTDLARLMDISQSQLHKLEHDYARLSESDTRQLRKVYFSFLTDVAAIRAGNQPPDAPWSPAARFWATRPELSEGGAVIDITG